MALEQQLRPASFRGIPFSIRTSTNKKGQKTIRHEYPNDPRRYVESLGAYKPVFNVIAIISDKDDNYIAHRDSLIRALDNKSIGILVHPWYGTLKVAVEGEYTIQESDANLGECVFEVSFAVADAPINPRQTTNQLSFINSVSETLDGNLITTISEGFSVAQEYTRNFTEAKLKVGNLINEFNVFSNYFGASSNTSALQATQNSFANDLTSSVKSPLSLADNISSLFSVANDVNDDPQAIFNGMQNLFNFGNDDISYSIITPETQQRITNNAIITYSTRAYALLYAYQNAVQIDFDNEIQLNLIKTALENQFLNLYEGSASDILDLSIYDLLGDDFFYNLLDLRNRVRLQFESMSLSVDRIANITVNTAPATILSYQYYGDLDETDQIISLNNIVDVSFVKGNLQVVTKAEDNI